MNKFSNVVTIFLLIVLAILPFLSPIINFLVSVKIISIILPSEVIQLKGLLSFGVVIIIFQIFLEFILSFVGYTSSEITRMIKENKITVFALESSTTLFSVIISYTICSYFGIGNVIFSKLGLLCIALIASFLNAVVTFLISKFLDE